ncbi:bifunctional serine/threonine-protein kinase/formylglycine-generating enzyme family protein [Oceanicoccus sp. KOV_DT_Chl]|uniref:bifunctional serine/threonine-protein kinase/formylglycine-generating enzyme family protein n=1 Tax=Oceanicoccus sp. KOV_DT_Chl TaxID=1904639 RepID=UPI0011AFCA5E|nr:bifunctional serine/threonine-protein kinase/formylglycine-generating enzyme family protein [Oceanicoccus sp. KOV_DT_Chl]
MTEIPDKLGFYKIIRKVGSGGMADVYEATDEQLDRQVALKVLPPEFARDKELSSRFDQEVLSTAKLKHPNIVTIYGVGHEEGYTFYTMELLHGGDLKAKINEGVSIKEVISIARQISKALAYAHKQGLVHRDIKPENILFNESGDAILTDLGIAKIMGKNTTQVGTTMGTPYYMSPEQAMASTIDGRSDLYSMGVIIYRMLTRELPFDAEDSQGIIQKHIQQAPPVLPDEFEEFQPLLDKLLAKSPDDRFQSGDALVSALDALERKMSRGFTDKNETTLMRDQIAKSHTSGPKSKSIITAASTSKKIQTGMAITVLIIMAVAAYLFSTTGGAPPAAHPTTAEVETDVNKEDKKAAVTGRAILYLNGQPAGAEVFFNEKSLGITPLTLENLPAGEQQITIQKQYYQPQQLSVTLVDDELVKSDYKLAKGQGTLTIISSPEQASVYLNGKLHPSTTPISIELLQAGEYTIKIQKEDGAFEGQFQLNHADKLVLRPTLTKGDLIAYNKQWFSQQELLALAEKDLTAKRAFLPAGDNALLKYRAILSASNNANKAAQQKLETVLTLINQSFEQLLANKAFDQASKQLSYVSAEIPEFKDISTIANRLKEAIAQEEIVAKQQQYKQQRAEINKLIKARNFKQAETKLKQLNNDFPKGEDNNNLSTALKQAKQDYANQVTRYSGLFVEVPKSSITLDTGKKLSVNPFYIGEKEITFSQWDACVQDNACSHKPEDNNWGRGNRPVINISLEDINSQFIPWLNRKTGLSYRLPTEAEWEQAVNSSSDFFWGSSAAPGFANGSQNFGWPNDGYKDSTAPVGSFKANSLGIFDLHGNVLEWTISCWTDQRDEKIVVNASTTDCSRFVTKGGSWKSGSKFMHTKARVKTSKFSRSNENGFRLVKNNSRGEIR